MHQENSHAQVLSFGDDIRKVLKKSGGSLVKVEYCGLRSFAYPIQKKRKGHYVLLKSESEPSGLQVMEKYLRDNPGKVMRFFSDRVKSTDSSDSLLHKKIGEKEEE